MNDKNLEACKLIHTNLLPRMRFLRKSFAAKNSYCRVFYPAGLKWLPIFIPSQRNGYPIVF